MHRLDQMHVCGPGYAHLLEPGYAHASLRLVSSGELSGHEAMKCLITAC
jgi:hypothetical protein